MGPSSKRPKKDKEDKDKKRKKKVRVFILRDVKNVYNFVKSIDLIVYC